jgi:sugar O-acyltransferase (sialic acid O-acetyltransferase NeuD family)
MKKIILIGGGGHANSCIDIIKRLNKFKIVYILEEKISNNLKNFKKVTYNKKNLLKINQKVKNAFICFGQIKNKKSRQRVFDELQNLKYNFPIIKSDTAYISKDSTILDGTIIMHRSVINSNVRIGLNNIINTGAIIEHDVTIGNHNHIAPGSIINGGVQIGNNCFIGSGAVIKQRIKIKDNSFVQAGKIILKNI